MNEIPALSVLIVFPQSPTEISDLLWSTLREDALSIEAVVVVDDSRHRDAAIVLGTIARADSRVRVLTFDSGSGRSNAIVAGLAMCRAEWVSVADANGVAVEGGYAALLASLQSSGSDLAVGSAESIAGRRHRVVRAADAALDTNATAIELVSRPGLITDDLLCTKVARASLMRAAVRPDEEWLEELIVARLYVAAETIDVLCRSVVFCRSRATSMRAKPMSAEWVAAISLIWATLSEAAMPVREAYAREAVRRGVLSSKAIELLDREPDRPDAADLVDALVCDLGPTAMANLSIHKRWQLAMIALCRSSLVTYVTHGGRRIESADVPSFDSTRLRGDTWIALGIAEGYDLNTAFKERFASDFELPTGITEASNHLDISVIIPTYNVAPYIDDLLESIRGAVDVNLEIIVVDDGSTDGTWDRVMAHHAVDPRIRLLRSPGVGGGQARDSAIELAQGDYLAFADGDDVVPPRAYSRLLSVARRSKADMVAGSYLKFFTTTTWDASSGYNQAYALPLENVTVECHPQLSRHRAVWNRLIRRDHWLATAFPFPGVPRSNDIVPMMSAMLSAQSVAVVPVQAYIYRDRPGAGSMSSAIGSADYTVSYFSEEATCAALVQQQGKLSISREYWAMVLNNDAWKNIVKFLDRQRVDSVEAVRVAEQIEKLLSRAPRSEFHALKPENQVVWTLAAGGRFDDARTILAAEKATSNVSVAVLSRAIGAADELNVASPAAINSLTLKYLVRRLINDVAWDQDAYPAASSVIRKRMEDPTMPLTVVPNSLEERLARALQIPDGADAQRAIRVGSSSISVRSVEGSQTELRGALSDVPANAIARVVARKFKSHERVRSTVAHVTVGDAEWSAVIDADAFPAPGVWLLELEIDDASGMRRSFLKIAETDSRLPTSRFRRVVAVQAGSNTSLVRVREPILVRLKRKVPRLSSTA